MTQNRVYCAMIFLTALAVYSATCWPDCAFNEQTRTAYAWLHGTMDIDAPDNFLEHAAFEGHKYALHPPMSAAVMVPFVAVWGMQTNQVWVSVLVGAIDVMLVWILLGEIGMPALPGPNAARDFLPSSRIPLTLFFAFGTTIWYEASTGTTWSLPSVVGMMFTLLTLNELFGARRGWLVGLWAGLAALGQYQYSFVIPVYALMLWQCSPASYSPQSSTSS